MQTKRSGNRLSACPPPTPVTVLSNSYTLRASVYVTGDSSEFSVPGTAGSSFNGVSLSSLLSLNPPPALADYAGLAPSSFSFLTDDYLSATVTNDSNMENHKAVTDFSSEEMKIEKNFMMSKPEPFQYCEEVANSETAYQPFDFFSKPSSNFYDPTTFHRLPDLHSLEPFVSDSSSAQTQVRLDSASPNPDLVNYSIVNQNFTLPNLNRPLALVMPYTKKRFASVPESSVGTISPSPIPKSKLARKRRQTLSDKTRCLQKLMPWDKKMDMATMLDEVYKYVKFLQAQLYALQSMPSDSAIRTQNDGSANKWDIKDMCLYGLERLNRNQVLQVLVNSPVSQTMLYSQGSCVISVEQLALLNSLSEKTLLLRQMTKFGNPSAKHFLQLTPSFTAFITLPRYTGHSIEYTLIDCCYR
ncbi:transcription factor bHLH [Quillaja saponaria]|uniref:Transcription factor bHLH n=1 Tax=Quillaja saponaria TaxID=32244 RepID=A0AAD7PAK7_QUISA|nr:transcription factor bHLH [Quillaja saponaria]